MDSVAVTVGDMQRSVAFYRDVLQFEPVADSEIAGDDVEHLYGLFGARLRIIALRAAAGPGVELLEYLAPRTGRPFPRDTLTGDQWSWHINLRGDVTRANTAARAGHYTYVSPGPVRLRSAPDGAGLFLRDPDGHGTLVLPAVRRDAERSQR